MARKKTALKKSGAAKKGKTAKPKKSTGSRKKFQTVRGMRDILPQEQPYWQRVRKAVEKVANDYGYQRIDLPLVEYRQLFERGAGATTDIVEKEIFKFKTRGGDDVALRPEGTPSAVRAYLQHGMQTLPKPVKLFYIGPMYRFDRPQEGRYREFFQFGFEAIGEGDSILDAQIIQLALRIFHVLKIKKVSLQINSIGCKECRPSYNKLLVSYLKNCRSSLCMNCKQRLKKNPLRILDCKEEKCARVIKQAPQTIDHLCDDCKNHFTSLLECLDEIQVPYVLNSYLVRGLDYYSRTVFEFFVESKETQSQAALGGGGRYDYLVKLLGGSDTPAVGFAMGMDRLVAQMKEQKVEAFEPPTPRVYLAQLGDLAKKKSLRIFDELERSGIQVAESFGRGNLRSQLKQADRLKAPIVLIIGQREALDETVILKDMASGSQEVITFAKIVKEVKKRVKRL
ncbi:MAG TPA: histidine--tRNA ligase [Candidatus Moranbacteria bacterium]|nr:histidine--tRNA ligase [Candidatus Moranbacteria bacterium]